LKRGGRWEKLGLIYQGTHLHPKLRSHAANPLPVRAQGDVYRVFFNGRDEQNRSSVGSLDFDLGRMEVIQVHDRPALLHGDQGSFFSHGISIGNCYQASGRRYLVFMGWQCPAEGHWRGEIGRMALMNDLSFVPESAEILLRIDSEDPLSLSYPWVLQAEGGYSMWYGSTVTWDAGNGEMLHVMKHATSRDGHTWRRTGIALPYQVGVAQAFSRPSVIGTHSDGYEMWFSYRGAPGSSYRIGHACSTVDLKWELDLEPPGLQVSADGWDADMMEYPSVFEHQGRLFMMYNGNGYGKSGIGIARLDREHMDGTCH